LGRKIGPFKGASRGAVADKVDLVADIRTQEANLYNGSQGLGYTITKIYIYIIERENWLNRK
jgi:hypothetical protein